MKSILYILLFSSLLMGKVNTISFAPGSWIVTPRHAGFSQSRYYNKLTVDGYFSIEKFKAYLQIPVAFTAYPSQSDNQFGLGDITWYLGWQAGIIQPRVGMVVPGIYSTDRPWIGSKDIRLTLGLALQPHYGKSSGGLFSFEAAWHQYLSEEFGLAERGSWGLFTITKGSYFLHNGLKLNSELLFNITSIEWQWTTPYREKKITAVPVFSGSYGITPIAELGIKGGFGPTFSAVADQPFTYSGTNLSLGLFLNFNL